MKTVAVFGAGIAGLTVAHELSRLGHTVVVYEATDDVGGFFRSARMPADDGRPSEYSWHGFGPWYHNAFDVLRQIPSAGGSVYDVGLSRPMDFGIAPDDAVSAPEVFDSPAMYRMTAWDRVMRAWLILRSSLSNRRSHERYARVNAREAWRPWMSDLGLRTWAATFGPWIGSDHTRISLHTAARFFLKNLFSGPEHAHVADAHGPAWTHGGGAEWLLLRGPSSEVWFDPWVAELERQGVRFRFRDGLRRLHTDGEQILGAGMEIGGVVEADAYVLATNPFEARDVLCMSEDIGDLHPQHAMLVAEGPHMQISFRLAFKEAIRWPRERAAIIVGDSPWNLTLFAQEQAWSPDVELGENTRSLWTGTACACTVPGRLRGLPATHCTKEQFVEEVMMQILSCESLAALLREENNGRDLHEFAMHRMEVWHEWTFSPAGIEGAQPKWVNGTTTQAHLPAQTTPLRNLFVAGAHTRTQADLWSIEAAVESGRRAAHGIDPRVPVIEQRLPWWLRASQAADDALYAVRAPHLLDVLFGLLVFACSALLAHRLLR